MDLHPVAPSSHLSRTRPAAPAPEAGLEQRLTQRQRQQLALWSDQLRRAPAWSGDLPVAVLEPSWLRLRRVALERLAAVLPPDGSEAAPELVRFRELRRAGLDDWTAQQQCWQDFGCCAFQQAQRRFWRCQEQGNHNWTLERYLGLLDDYRRQLAPGVVRRLPLLLLARQGTDDQHVLVWLATRRDPIGHTCA
ncbi:MAG: hypothetical protein VKM97_00340 [Cyanobacteriota bacterium]|nr:hypothetical protein [Cyanobacteriota bacterium]